MASRRFSQAISEGDGISVLVDVHDAASAWAAEEQGAEAVVVRGDVGAVRGATELPILWRSSQSLDDVARAGADACLLVVDEHGDEDELARLHARALELGLDCVVEVRDEDELDRALERLDPEIFLLSCDAGERPNALERALELLPAVPAGKLAVADVSVSGRDQVVELERAGVDAVIVGARNVAELVGDAPPPV
jgi:indole-3-glycerol phosphate synthase